MQPVSLGMSENASGEAEGSKFATPKSGSAKRYLDNENWLQQQYWDHGKSTQEIAEQCDCAPNTVLYWLNKHGIPTRDPGKELCDNRITDRHWFERQYHDNGKSTKDIAELCGCAPETAREWKRKHGIETNTKYKSRGEGPDNPNWNGGTRKYGPNWEEQREKALDRDNYRCQACGVWSATKYRNAHLDETLEEKEEIRKLHVHHIVPRSEYVDSAGRLDYECANQLDNLVTLCGSCHNRWEGIPLKPDNRDDGPA